MDTKSLRTEFCRTGCSMEIRLFIERVFHRGFREGLAEGRRQKLLSDTAGKLIDEFVTEELALVPSGKVQASLLFRIFCEWQEKKHGGKEMHTATWFGRRLRSRFVKLKSNGLVFYRGVVFKKDYINPSGAFPAEDLTADVDSLDKTKAGPLGDHTGD